MLRSDTAAYSRRRMLNKSGRPVRAKCSCAIGALPFGTSALAACTTMRCLDGYWWQSHRLRQSACSTGCHQAFAHVVAQQWRANKSSRASHVQEQNQQWGAHLVAARVGVVVKQHTAALQLCQPLIHRLENDAAVWRCMVATGGAIQFVPEDCWQRQLAQRAPAADISAHLQTSWCQCPRQRFRSCDAFAWQGHCHSIVAAWSGAPLSCAKCVLVCTT